MAFTIDEDSRRRIVAAAQQAERLFGSPRPILAVLGVEVLAWIGETFRDGGRPTWAPLAASTLAGRRQDDGAAASTGRALVDKGRLRDSFDEKHSVQPKVLTDTHVEIGSDDPRAVWHHYGTRPYVIRPKQPGGVLAFPAIVSGAAGVIGQRSLTGLGRARGPSASGSFVLPAGRSVRGRQGGQRIQPFKAVTFARSVNHPGLTPRPMLPTPEQIVPRLVKAATLRIQQLVRGRA